MTERTINKIKVKMYDSIDELPIVNFQKFNKLMVIDSGIGSEIEDIDLHINNMANLMKTDINSALIELVNMQQLLYYIKSEINVKYIAYMTFIHEINGEVVTDLSDENLMHIFEKLNSAPKGVFDKIFEVLKKKVNDEFELYFPDTADSPKKKEFYDLLKERTNEILIGIQTGEIDEKAILSINTKMIMLEKPKLFSGSDSLLVKIDKNFDKMCATIAKRLFVNAKSLTVREFYNNLELLSDKNFN